MMLLFIASSASFGMFWIGLLLYFVRGTDSRLAKDELNCSAVDSRELTLLTDESRSWCI